MKHYVISITFIFLALNASAETKLSETGLYADISTKVTSPTVRRFSPQYPLWTDGAEKQRWVYLPPGTQIDSKDQDHWTFPNGTKFWKEFSFGGKRVETRLLEKKSDGTWNFSTFLWDETDQDAVVADTAGKTNYYPTPFGTYHDIPSLAQCQSCHRRGGDPILGFDPLQLSNDRDPRGLHQNSLSESDLTLKDLIAENLLTAPPTTSSPRIASTTDAGRAAMGYLHGNCGHCHNPSGKASFTGQYLRHQMSAVSETDEPAFSTTVDKLTRMFQIPGQRRTYRIRSGDPDHSAIPYRMDRRDGDQMPPIDTKVIDREAVDLIREWISHL